MPQANFDKQTPKPMMKVWRPQEFEGVEVERFDHVIRLSLAPFIAAGHDMTVIHRGGEMRLGYERRTYQFEADNLYVNQHAGAPLFLDPLDDTPVSVWTLRLYPEAMRQLRGDLGLSHGFSYFPEMIASAELNDTLAKLTAETVLSFDRPAPRLERESRLLGLVYAVLKHCSDTPPPEVKLGQEHSAVSLVKEVLHAHPEQGHRLGDLATLAKLNKYYLWEVFTRDVGVTPDRYQTCLRVNRAEDLLARGISVAQAALSAGFSDQSHLTRTFKKYTQVTPGRFQRDTLAS